EIRAKVDDVVRVPPHRFDRKVHAGIGGVWNQVVALSGLLLEPRHLLGLPLPKVEIRHVLAPKPFSPGGGGPGPEGPVHPYRHLGTACAELSDGGTLGIEVEDVDG